MKEGHLLQASGFEEREVIFVMPSGMAKEASGKASR